MAAKFTISDRVAEIIYDGTSADVAKACKLADAILDLPEIKEALKAHERLVGKPHA
jgi:hypothetical protein